MTRKRLFSENFFPEIIELDIKDEIDGFERVVLGRLFSSFNSIEDEAQEKSKNFLERRSRSFNPDYDDEGIIAEDVYFVELNHIFMEEKLKQEFLNYSVVWLNHIFEEQKNRIFGEISQDEIQKELGNSYDLNRCLYWISLNREMRVIANAIKHGMDSGAAKTDSKKFPYFIVDRRIKVEKIIIQKYIENLRCFWKKALNGRIASFHRCAVERQTGLSLD